MSDTTWDQYFAVINSQRDERRAAIRARLEAATPGPWHQGRADHRDEWGCVNVGDYGWVTPVGMEYGADSEQGRADAELIAHAPDDLAYLLDAVEALVAELSKR
jgi:hypothetical protein